MECRQLYNIEDDTLVTFHPKKLCLEVKNNFSQCYFLDREAFAVLYYLVISYPHPSSHKDIKEMLEDLDIEYPGNVKFDKYMQLLKRLLLAYGIKDMITYVKGYGYAINNKWVPPENHTKKQRKERHLRLLKLIGLTFPANSVTNCDHAD